MSEPSAVVLMQQLIADAVHPHFKRSSKILKAREQQGWGGGMRLDVDITVRGKSCDLRMKRFVKKENRKQSMELHVSEKHIHLKMESGHFY